MTRQPSISAELPNAAVAVAANAAAGDANAARHGSLRFRALAIFLAVWFFSSAYVGANLLRGWIPHDDGTLAQSAERVMHGQLPHRDYIELYTGGLSYWNVLAFHLFGVNLASLRWMMFLVFLAWVPALYFVARELMADWAAGALTVLAVAWSVPNYPAAMPSWYNLFFATFGIAALFAYIKRPSRAWLFAAGLCGGVSFLVKSIGLYFIAAVLLFFIYREQDESTDLHASAKSAAAERIARPLNSSPGYSLFIVVCLLGLLAVLILLSRARLGLPEFLHYFLPPAAVAALLIVRQISGGRSASSSLERFAALSHMAIPFLAGALAPVILFLLPYLKSQAVSPLLSGVFVIPFKRVLGQFMRPTGIESLLPAAAFGILIALAFRARRQVRSVLTVIVLGSLVLAFLESFYHRFAYAISWNLVQSSIPLLSVVGALALYSLGTAGILFRGRDQARPRQDEHERRQRVMLLLGVTAMCSLVQFPFAAPIYFSYVAPLALLSIGAILALFPQPPHALLFGAGAFAFLFATLIMRTGGIYSLGWEYSSNNLTARMVLPRAGALRVTPETASIYNELIPFVRDRAQGHAILAGPDCPEVYFLSGAENPTPSLFEIFDNHEVYEARIRKLFDEKSIRVAVLNHGAQVSSAFLQPLENVAHEKLPLSRSFGGFEVRWRP